MFTLSIISSFLKLGNLGNNVSFFGGIIKNFRYAKYFLDHFLSFVYYGNSNISAYIMQLTNIFKDSLTRAIFWLFLSFTLWWLIIRLTHAGEDFFIVQFFSGTYGLMALCGGLIGLHASKKWGGWDSTIGRALIVFSISLFFQEFGQLTYSFYTYFLQEQIPYPSVADIGYLGSVPVYIYGVWLLVKASGGKFSLRHSGNKLLALLIPLIGLLLSYLVFLRDYEFDFSQPLSLVLDLLYPLGESVYISLALLAYYFSKNLLGGVMKNKVLFVLFALVLQYLAEFVFLYQASKGTWVSGGINDYMYFVSYTAMAFALTRFNAVANDLRSKFPK